MRFFKRVPTVFVWEKGEGATSKSYWLCIDNSVIIYGKVKCSVRKWYCMHHVFIAAGPGGAWG